MPNVSTQQCICIFSSWVNHLTFLSLFLQEGRVFVCGVKYREEDYMVPEDDDDVSDALLPDWLTNLYRALIG